MRERTTWAGTISWVTGGVLLLGIGCSGTTTKDGNSATGGDPGNGTGGDAGSRTELGGAPSSGGSDGTGDAPTTGGNDAQPCGPGEVRTCSDGACRGNQACRADGTWSACVCSESTGGVGSGGAPTGGAGTGGARTGGAPTGGVGTGGGRTGGAPTGGIGTGGFATGGGGDGGVPTGGSAANPCDECMLENCRAEIGDCIQGDYCMTEYVAIQTCLEQEYADNGVSWVDALEPCAAAAAVDIFIEPETNALVSCTVGDGVESGCATECFDFSSDGVGGTGGSGNPCGAGTLCSGECVDTSSDPLNCGACGRVCAAGTTCAAGVCVCAAGLINCSGVCVNVQTDGANCGACANLCGPGELCAAGFCISQG